MAALLGIDPRLLTETGPVSRALYRGVLREATKLDQNRRQALVNAIGVAVGNAVAKQLSRMFK